MEPKKKDSSSSVIVRKITSSNNLTMKNLSVNKKDSNSNVRRKNSSKAFIEPKKTKIKLPEKFFEQLLNEELKLKREFNIDTLQTLVDSYSVS